MHKVCLHYQFLFIKDDFLFTGSCKHTSSAHWPREKFTIAAVFRSVLLNAKKKNQTKKQTNKKPNPPYFPVSCYENTAACL